jgi:tRNA(Arg) A34 adenosine deaminase TadA
MGVPDIKFIHLAIELARKGMESGIGGPFGCVIVKDQQIVAKGMNCVTSHNDPTAHAEIVAIREACRTLGTFQLSGCDLYTSCEPCPMCFGAIYWARPDNVFYACNRHDAAAAGFDDHFIYEQLQHSANNQKIPMIGLGRTEGLRVFEEWRQKTDRLDY